MAKTVKKTPSKSRAKPKAKAKAKAPARGARARARRVMAGPARLAQRVRAVNRRTWTASALTLFAAALLGFNAYTSAVLTARVAALESANGPASSTARR